MAEITILPISLLDFNKGQLKGLPKNPRFFRDYRYEAMKKSIQESPEMLELRELIVFHTRKDAISSFAAISV